MAYWGEAGFGHGLRAVAGLEAPGFAVVEAAFVERVAEDRGDDDDEAHGAHHDEDQGAAARAAGAKAGGHGGGAQRRAETVELSVWVAVALRELIMPLRWMISPFRTMLLPGKFHTSLPSARPWQNSTTSG